LDDLQLGTLEPLLLLPPPPLLLLLVQNKCRPSQQSPAPAASAGVAATSAGIDSIVRLKSLAPSFWPRACRIAAAGRFKRYDMRCNDP